MSNSPAVDVSTSGASWALLSEGKESASVFHAIAR